MKPRKPLPPDAVPDYGADGAASLARPSAVRAVQPEAGHATVNVRECHDVLAIDRLLNAGKITAEMHAAGLHLNRLFDLAGFNRHTTARYDQVRGGESDAPALREWFALIDRVPDRCRHVVVSVCCANREGQDPTSAMAEATLRAGLDALVSVPRRPPDALIRAAWSGPPEAR